jgi:hypothetical protein
MVTHEIFTRSSGSAGANLSPGGYFMVVRIVRALRY